MKRSEKTRYWGLAVAMALLACTTGCDSTENEVSPDDFSILGTWELTELEGAPSPVNASNSTWTFRSDGTYAWFLFYPGFFDLDGGGQYMMDGNVLTVTGTFAQTVIAELPGNSVTLTLGHDRFSFRDDEGDRWTYVRQ